jgi:hypothetical protein
MIAKERDDARPTHDHRTGAGRPDHTARAPDESASERCGRPGAPGRIHVHTRKSGEAEVRSEMTRVVHVPYTVEQDEDGVWCAHAQLQPGVGANGEGGTRQAAVDDLREALAGLIAEFGVPNELTLTVDVA